MIAKGNSPDRRAKLKGALAFFQHEAAGGLLLMAAAVVARVVSNSSLEWLYDRLLDTPVGVRAGPLALEKNAFSTVSERLIPRAVSSLSRPVSM